MTVDKAKEEARAIIEEIIQYDVWKDGLHPNDFSYGKKKIADVLEARDKQIEELKRKVEEFEKEPERDYEKLKQLHRHKTLMEWDKSDLVAHSIKYQSLAGHYYFKFDTLRSIAERMAYGCTEARNVMRMYITEKSATIELLDGILADWEKMNQKGNEDENN